MARICFTQNCAGANNGTPAPYYAVPEAGTPLGSRVRTKDGSVLAHLLPPEILSAPVDPKQATHVVYTFDGRTVARDLTKGKVFRVSDDEAAHLDNNFHALIQRMPSEELHEDTIGALLDEKKAASDKAEEADAKLNAALALNNELAVDLAKAKAEMASFAAEADRLKSLLDKANAPKPAPSKTSASKEK